MGYCWQGKKLVCDICGHAGARKYRCPFGYCSPAAACSKCRKEHTKKFGKAAHRAHGCEENHNRFMAERALEQSLLDSGFALRCSVKQAGPDRVHVLFRKKDNSTIGFYMKDATYASYPLGVPVTPEMYKDKQGYLLEIAPPTYEYGNVTKQLVNS